MFLKSIIFGEKGQSFDKVLICPANISNWLPQLIKEIKKFYVENKSRKSFLKALRIGSCGDHELPFFEPNSREYKGLIELYHTIKQVSANSHEFTFMNPIYCIDCKKLDFCEWNYWAPLVVLCSGCNEPIELHRVCCTCINMCNCWKDHFDYDLLPFLKDCGAFICKSCSALKGPNYYSEMCPNK